MSKPVNKQRAWSELVKSIIHPPKRYKHQRDSSHQAKIVKLRKQSS